MQISNSSKRAIRKRVEQIWWHEFIPARQKLWELQHNLKESPYTYPGGSMRAVKAQLEDINKRLDFYINTLQEGGK